MNKTKEYKRGEIIVREGGAGNSMFEIQFGRVGIYRDYGKATETKLAELDTGKVFGEMSLLDHAPRSATAVVLEDHTAITEVAEEDFYAYFEQNPVKVLEIAKQMCNRLRVTTQNYKDACHTVYDTVETEKKGEEKSKSLLERIKELCDFYSTMSFRPYY